MSEQLPQHDAIAKLEAVRVVLAVVTNRETELTVASIANATALTEDVVRDVMNGRDYQRMMEGEIAQIITASMLRGVKRMDEIMNGDKATDAVKVMAHRAVVATFSAISQARKHAPPDEAPPIEEFLQDFGVPDASSR